MPEGVPSVADVNNSQLKNLLQLRELVYVPLRDNERSFVEPWFVDAMINEALYDLNARLRIRQQVDTGNTSSTGTIPYPSDMVEVMGLWITDVNGSAQPLQFVTQDVFNSWARPGGSMTSPSAYLARVFGAIIETYPVFATRPYRLEFVGRPAELAQDTDRPVDLHPEMTPRLVSYAQAKAKWQEGEVEEGNQYMAQYEAGLPGPPRMLNAIHPEPLLFVPEPGPFDA